jgi:outer membrane biogenesis lipoprotein LolB
MTLHKIVKTTLFGVVCLGLAACGGNANREAPRGTAPREFNNDVDAAQSTKSSIWDLFGGTSDQKVQVNRYLWNATLDVLEFLPGGVP